MAQPIGKRAYTKAFRELIDFPGCVRDLATVIADPITYDDQIVTDNYEDGKGLTVCHGAYAMQWLGTYNAIVAAMMPERLSYETLERLGQDTEQHHWAQETLCACLEDAARRFNLFVSFEDQEVYVCKDFETFLPNPHITSPPNHP
jgi:hypothetical protein